MFLLHNIATVLRFYIVTTLVMKSFFTLNLDCLGTCTSVLCGLHCLIAPILVFVLPTFTSSIFNDHHIELGFLGCSIILASLSLIRSFIQIHKNSYPLVWGAFGVGLLLASQLVNTALIEIGLSVSGGGFIAIAHVFNWNLCNRYLKIKEGHTACRPI